MVKKNQTDNKEELKNVFEAISDYIFENHRVCGIAEICNITQLPKPKCDQLISTLIQQKQIYEIFSGKGKPSLYIPYDMMQGILSLQQKPKWMEKYEFEQKKEDSEQIEKLKKKIIKFEEFERILYTTDKPLEKALAFCLEFLEFEDVKHLDNGESHDVEFKDNGKIFLVEAKGKTKPAEKTDVQQLRGWIDKKIEEGYKAEEVRGILAVNHYRNDDPQSRAQPLTDKAVEFLKLGNYIFITTIFLFNIIKEVISDKLSKEDARKKIIIGESY